MNFFSIKVADALTVWDGVKSKIEKTIISRQKECDGLDYSFITPSILALAKFQDSKIDELSQILQGNSFVLWNLSGKPFSSATKDALNYQILESPWLTPGQFTQAPSLECLFAQCYSIKTWLDLNSNHVAIIHCANGRSRSGILIACLLKQMGAFENSSSAFDFFCSARSQSEVKPTLAPSYRILFENIDEAVNHGGYPNVLPLHLKCVAISGLPVDEIPCVEIWDTTGVIFSSHNGLKSTSKCTWSNEYGDGFFRVTADILGDFSVMCRFGGSHAMTRDKTTLIFKYQNSTAFLTSEVIELKRQNVDINPEYSDSLDNELFTVHLMFEKSQEKDHAKRLPERNFCGKLSSSYFESGISEISKYHIQEPDSIKFSTLVEMGYSEKFVPVALQLANNITDDAARYLQLMKQRESQVQQCNSTPHKGTPYLDAISVSDSFSNENSELKRRSSWNGEPLTSDTTQTNICSVCNEDNHMKRDQLVQCVSCAQEYHTTCFGARRIPFSLKTTKEKQNREKFIKKHYHDWRCSACVSKGECMTATVDHNVLESPTESKRHSTIGAKDKNDGKFSSILPNYSQAWKPTLTSSGDVSYLKTAADDDEIVAENEQHNNHDQAAFLIGILAVSGYNIENLMMLSEEKQREALVEATNHYNSKIATPSKTAVPTHGRYVENNNNNNNTLNAANNRNAPTVLNVVSSQGENASFDTAVKDSVDIADTNQHVSKDSFGHQIATSDSQFSKYLKMIKVGLPKMSVAQKMMSDGIVGTIQEGIEVLNKNPEEIRSSVTTSNDNISQTHNTETVLRTEENKNENLVISNAQNLVSANQVSVSEHAVYSKYFKMLKVGINKDAVKKRMEADGVDSSYIERNPDDLILVDDSNINSTASGKTICLSEHPLYSKYFKMLKFGLQKDQVKNKMEQEGVNSKYLDMNPSDLVPIEAQLGESVVKSNPLNIIKKSVKQAVRKKRLHWKALDASKVGDNTLWANDKDKDDDIKLDEEEFNQLFVDRGEPLVAQKDTSTKDNGKKKRINIIDMKRAQNGGISLARIKIPFLEVRSKIENMEDECFSTDQLISLAEFLPMNDEIPLLKAYKGDVELLGPAEKYMTVMLNFPTAAQRIECMIYKQQFKTRIQESKTILSKIENACDDVKMSIKLKKVLKTILKVGNQMNDDEEHAGFTLDSLLKLQSAKAFDKKTSILQYVIMLIQRNDESILQFPNDLPNISEASRLILDSINVEALQLRQGLDNACKIITSIRQNESGNMSGMAAFLYKATQKCDELDANITNVKTKYASVLSYFGEESSMPSSEFFSTLFKFVQEFILARDSVLRKNKSNLKTVLSSKDVTSSAGSIKKDSAENVIPNNNS